MKALLAVAYMEARDRAALLAVALAIGLALVILPLLGSADADVTESGQAALVLAAVTACVMSLMLGVSAPVRDAATRRLAFYMSRPLTPFQIWAGRILGLGVLVLLCAALVVMPAAALGAVPEVPDHPALMRLSLGVVMAALAAACLTLLVTGYGVSAALHGSVSSLVIGLACFALVGAVVVRALQRLLDDVAPLEALLGAGGFGGVTLATALVAGWIHVARSRADPRRGAAALSLVLWGGLGLGAAGLEAWSRSVVEIGPAEIRPVSTALSPDGSSIVVQGQGLVRDLATVTLLVDVASGHHVEIARAVFSPYAWLPDGSGEGSPTGIVFATDGSCVAWASQGGLSLRVARTGSQPAMLPGSMRPDERGGFLPWDEGRRVVLLRNHRNSERFGIDEVEVASGRIAWSRDLLEGVSVQLLAAGADGVLIVQHDALRTREPWPLLLRLRNAGSQQPPSSRATLEQLAVLEGMWDVTFDVDPMRGLVLAVDSGGTGLLVPLDDGAPRVPHVALANLARTQRVTGHPRGHVDRAAWLLSDGRVLSVRPEESVAIISHRDLPAPPASSPMDALRLHARDGQVEREIPVPRGHVIVQGECAPGQVIACVEVARGRWACSVLDVAAGTSMPLPDDLMPIDGWSGQLEARGARIVPAPGSDRSMIFATQDSLVWFNPTTGERRVIVGSPG